MMHADPDVLPDFFTVVIPVLNEERYIEAALTSLLDQVRDLRCEIMVVDGGSQDRTVAIVEALAAAGSGLRVVHNPARLQSAACNLAAGRAAPQSRILLRADAHAGYPPGFVRACLRALAETGATSVVVPMRTVGTGAMQRAIAATQNSLLGNGGSSHRRVGTARFVEHGHHAAFDLNFFRTIGGYDPTFTHNEDAELDVRALQAGGRIWLCPDAMIDYYPRETLRQLARQYVRHGRGRARTTAKHRQRLRLRQCLPIAILGAFVLALLAPVQPLLALPAGCYVGACLLWGAVQAVRRRDPALLWMGPAAIVMHLAWAVGFLDGRAKRRPTQSAHAPIALETV